MREVFQDGRLLQSRGFIRIGVPVLTHQVQKSLLVPWCGYRKLSPSWKRENLVCMPTLSAGETDRGNHSVAIQRRSESQSGECKGQSGVSSRRDCLVHKKNGSYRRGGPANTKRRGVGIGDGVLQAEESRRCTRFLASPLLSTPERPWPMPNGFGSAGSRQNNLSESGATIFHSTQ